MSISAWVVIGPSLRTHWLSRRDAEAADETYNGPCDDTSYAILNSAADPITVQDMYKTKTVQGQTPFTLFNMNFSTEQEATDAVAWLDSEWPGKQYETQGMWAHDTGLQVGVTYTYDEEGEITGTTGTPTYPIPADCYLVMPDVITYDENGDVDTTTPASSNADLKDINLMAGQAPRVFA